ncbi:MAG: hypothetical protein ACRYFS_05745 [Janthinobacterium lividum]
MNVMQFAMVLIRLTGLGWFVDSAFQVTYIPTDLLGFGHFQSGYFAQQHMLEIVLKLFRIFLDFGIGLYFLLHAEFLAHWATKGLEKFAPQQLAGVWPPSPLRDGDKTSISPHEPTN